MAIEEIRNSPLYPPDCLTNNLVHMIIRKLEFIVHLRFVQNMRQIIYSLKQCIQMASDVHRRQLGVNMTLAILHL